MTSLGVVNELTTACHAKIVYCINYTYSLYLWLITTHSNASPLLDNPLSIASSVVSDIIKTSLAQSYKHTRNWF